jgi:hypothetical protein
MTIKPPENEVFWLSNSDELKIFKKGSETEGFWLIQFL